MILLITLPLVFAKKNLYLLTRKDCRAVDHLSRPDRTVRRKILSESKVRMEVGYSALALSLSRGCCYLWTRLLK